MDGKFARNAGGLSMRLVKNATIVAVCYDRASRAAVGDAANVDLRRDMSVRDSNFSRWIFTVVLCVVIINIISYRDRELGESLSFFAEMSLDFFRKIARSQIVEACKIYLTVQLSRVLLLHRVFKVIKAHINVQCPSINISNVSTSDARRIGYSHLKFNLFGHDERSHVITIAKS